ncbi:MAG: hypothetical protein RL199_391 [Pseudomonadota bacterium]|jgi:hypothetical protein
MRVVRLRGWRAWGLVVALVAVAGLLVAALFVSIMLALAVVGPAAGVLFARTRLKAANRLWCGRGRLPFAGGYRVLPSGRWQPLALLHVMSAAGGLAAGLTPTLLVFVTSDAWLSTGLAGLVTVLFAQEAGARLLAGARTVDVLPKE